MGRTEQGAVGLAERVAVRRGGEVEQEGQAVEIGIGQNARDDLSKRKSNFKSTHMFTGEAAL